MDFPHAGWRFATEKLHEIRGDDDPVVRRDAEQGKESDPNRHRHSCFAYVEKMPQIHAEGGDVHEPRLPVGPDQEETPGSRKRHTREDHERRGRAAELQVQQHEDDGQSKRHQDHQALRASNLVLVGAGESVAHTRRNDQLA